MASESATDDKRRSGGTAVAKHGALSGRDWRGVGVKSDPVPAPPRSDSKELKYYAVEMRSRRLASGDYDLLRKLADFRFELRAFLHFSESAAQEAGLQPQQHQLLLQVAGAPETVLATVAYVAKRLALKHNSAVELVDRSEREGLLRRTSDAGDKRRAILRLTRKGKQIIAKLSDEHARELNEMAPRLIAALNKVRLHSFTEVRAGSS